MNKTTTLPTKTESKKPSIRFVPKLRQYESGIDYMDLTGFKHKITLEGWTAPTMEDQTRILRMMERDPFCAITTYENREMPAEQKRTEGELRVSLAKQAAMQTEMDAMRKELDDLKKNQKPASGG